MSFEEKWGMSLERAATALDEQLRVVENGRVKLCIGLSASFYVANGHESQTRHRIADVFDHYRSAVGDALVWGGDPKTGRPKRTKDSPMLDSHSWIGRLGPHDDYQPVFHGGPHKDDASPYMFSVLARSGQLGVLSSTTFALPMQWAVDKEQGAYLRLILDTCALLHPQHGYAGLGIVLHVAEYGDGPIMEHAVALASRFRGLELDFAFRHSRDLTRAEATKGVNWLTILSDGWIDKLGGRAAVEDDLGPDIPIHPYDGGVVIQAGSHPRFGDVNRAEPMQEYEQVARVLKPIRAEEIQALAPRHGFDRARTAQWLNRFDP